MKQVTGNNASPAGKRLSIRLKAGGHSFSVDMLPKAALDSDAEAVFEVITHKSTLVPSEAFDPQLAEDYLAVVGLACSEDECAVYAERNGTVAVMAISRNCRGQIAEALGERASYTSPLLAEHAPEKRTLYLCAEEETLYLKFYDNGGLIMAEALPSKGTDDILYYAAAAGAEFGPAQYDIILSGTRARAAYKILNKYFKNVKCE